MPLADRDVELKQSGEDETDAESLVGIGLDSCVLKTRYPDMHLVQIKDVMTPEQVKRTYDMAMASMAKLNRRAAGLMRKYGAHGATDVTGFGILGHAQNLAEAQTAEVDLVLDMLPTLSDGITFAIKMIHEDHPSDGTLANMAADVDAEALLAEHYALGR
ncbi:uncharacterized protein MONBRDRAFT_8404, partial [Monosiga brevicollis MX1]